MSDWAELDVASGMEVGQLAGGDGADLQDMGAEVVEAIMDRAVELVAARGGTMTSGAVSHALNGAAAREPLYAEALRQHIAAQGARIAALEQHVSELEKSLENARKERDEAVALDNRWYRDLQEAECREKDQRHRAEKAERERDQRHRAEKAERERDAALADNAALWASLNAILAHVEMNADMRARCQGDFAHASWVRDTRHPGAALLERLKSLEAIEALRKAGALP